MVGFQLEPEPCVGIRTPHTEDHACHIELDLVGRSFDLSLTAYLTNSRQLGKGQNRRLFFDLREFLERSAFVS